MMKVQAARVKTDKERREIVAERVVDHKERLERVKREQRQRMRDQGKSILDGAKKRDDQVKRNMSFLNEENERRKEVKHLHKIDQEDNLQRKKAFERMGLENKVQMILEKASRVQRP